MGRRFKLSVEANTGQIHDVYVTLDGRVVLQGDGSESRTYMCDDLPEQPVTIRVSVTGVPGSRYTVTVDLPEQEDDFMWGYTLESSVQTVEFHV